MLKYEELEREFNLLRLENTRLSTSSLNPNNPGFYGY